MPRRSRPKKSQARKRFIAKVDFRKLINRKQIRQHEAFLRESGFNDG